MAKKKRFYNKKGSKSLRKMVLSNKAKINKIKSVIETKHYESNAANQAIPSTSYVQFLNGIATGADEDARIGDEITLGYLTIRGHLHNDNAGTPTDGICRFLVYMDMEQNGSATDTPLSTVLESAGVNQVRNWNNKDRIKILHDETFAFDDTVKKMIPFKIRIKLGHKIIYKTAGSSNSDIQKGALYFAGITTVSSGSNDEPKVDLVWRLTYKDA